MYFLTFFKWNQSFTMLTLKGSVILLFFYFFFDFQKPKEQKCLRTNDLRISNYDVINKISCFLENPWLSIQVQIFQVRCHLPVEIKLWRKTKTSRKTKRENPLCLRLQHRSRYFRDKIKFQTSFHFIKISMSYLQKMPVYVNVN